MKKNYKILVVDDDQYVREMLFESLELDFPGSLVEASDGLDGLEKLRELLKSGNDVFIISDINMPKMNGFEMIEHVIQEKLDCGIMVISGYFENLQKMQATFPQVIFHMKPVEVDECVKKINQWIESQ